MTQRWSIGNEDIKANSFDEAIKEYNKRTGAKLPSTGTRPQAAGGQAQGRGGAPRLTARQRERLEEQESIIQSNLMGRPTPVGAFGAPSPFSQAVQQRIQDDDAIGASTPQMSMRFAPAPTSAQTTLNNMSDSELGRMSYQQLLTLRNNNPELVGDQRLNRYLDLKNPSNRTPQTDAERNQLNMYLEYDNKPIIGAKTLHTELGVPAGAVRTIIRTVTDIAKRSGLVSPKDLQNGLAWNDPDIQDIARDVARAHGAGSENRIVAMYLANGNYRNSMAVNSKGSAEANKARTDAGSSITVAQGNEVSGAFQPSVTIDTTETGGDGTGYGGDPDRTIYDPDTRGTGMDTTGSDDGTQGGFPGEEVYGEGASMVTPNNLGRTWGSPDTSAFGRERSEFPGAFSGFLQNVMPAGISSPYARRQAQRAQTPLTQSFMLGTGLGRISGSQNVDDLASLSLPQWLGSLEDPFNLQNIGGMPGGYLDLVKEAGKVLGDPSRISSLPQGIGSGFMNWLADNPREQQNIAVQAGMQGVPTWMRGYAAQGLEDLSNQWLVQNPQGNLLTNFVNQGMRF